MQVNKRTAAEQDHRDIKKLKAKIAAEESAEEAALKYSKEDAHSNQDETNIDAELISHQAQDYADAEEEATNVASSYVQSTHSDNDETGTPQTQGSDQAQDQIPQRATQQILHQSSDKPLAGSEEWHRIRKDNHKEVERRRRETINAGVKELAALLPSPETNKSQILQRAIEYIKRLKENENNNNEKWTLEKLLNDQTLAELAGANEKLKAELERAYREVEHWKKACSLKNEDK
jgi:bHLH factor